MRYLASLSLLLIAFWLVLSGHYTALLLGFGAASVALVLWIANRMAVVDHEMVPLRLTHRIPLYALWLTKEIILSSIKVSIRVLRGPQSLNPGFRPIAHGQSTSMGETILANSITLTPGTLSVRVDDRTIDVHSIDEAFIDELETGRFATRVRQLDTGS